MNERAISQQEQEAIDAFKGRVAAVPKPSALELLRREREAEQQARQAAARHRAAALEAGKQSKQAAVAKRQEREAAQKEAARARGVELFYCYVDLGPRWTRRWLFEHVAPEVPEVMHAPLDPSLTCSALREGLEAVRSTRRRRKVEHPLALLVRVAADYQQARPRVLLPRHEAFKRPHLICPHNF